MSNTLEDLIAAKAAAMAAQAAYKAIADDAIAVMLDHLTSTGDATVALPSGQVTLRMVTRKPKATDDETLEAIAQLIEIEELRIRAENRVRIQALESELAALTTSGWLSALRVEYADAELPLTVKNPELAIRFV